MHNFYFFGLCVLSAITSSFGDKSITSITNSNPAISSKPANRGEPLNRREGHYSQGKSSRISGGLQNVTATLSRTVMPDGNCTSGLYLSPQMGSTFNALSDSLNITWDPTCFSSSKVSQLDIYLYAPNTPAPRIHVWERVTLSKSAYQAQLMPRWWNSTASQQLQIIIVPTSDPPFMSQFPAGPVFTALYTAPSSGSVPLAADTSQIDSGITVVDDVAKQEADKKSASGRVAAGILIPLILIALAVAFYIKMRRLKEREKRRAWTEKVDTRMSTISMEWKSVSAAGANAAIRNSIAVGSRNSSFSFSAIRPLSNYAVEGEDNAPKPSGIRTGTGVGLRNPNNAAVGPRSSSIARVSFADQQPPPRPSTDSSKRSTSRAFHSAYIPPVPSLPDPIVEKDSNKDFSPRQTAGPLTLTSDDINSRIVSRNTTTNKSSVHVTGLGLDEVMPALSLMRTTNQDSADYILPTPPEPTYSPTSVTPSPTTTTVSTPHPTTSLTSSFPTPPTTVLSPDEMLRAYAERKKSLADAAKAGKIGGLLKSSPSFSSSIRHSIGFKRRSTVSNGSGNGAMGTSTMPVSSQHTGGSNRKIETVSSIHATGMRVAYHSEVTPTIPSSSSSSPDQKLKNPYKLPSLPHDETPVRNVGEEYVAALEGGAEDDVAASYAYAYAEPEYQQYYGTWEGQGQGQGY